MNTSTKVVRRAIGIVLSVVFTTFYIPLTAIAAEESDELGWPKEISYERGKIVIYQPQPEKLDGNQISGRSAISIEPDNGEPIFGAAWFTARIDTDTDSGITRAHNLKITKVAWPDSTGENEEKFTKVVEASVPSAGFTLSMERLSASLTSAEIERKSLENLNTEPPIIVFREDLAVLLIFDGEPKFQEIENTDYERALNTPLVVVKNKKSKLYYLSSGVLYYEAEKPLGPWTPTTSPPADLVSMLPKPEDDQSAPSVTPKIVTAVKPTELVSTDGKPEWSSLTGGKLLYVSNTETAWLRDLESGKMYLLLSGRWFASSKSDGPWEFVRPDKLPSGFKEIPPASDIGGTRVAVAGTLEADQAMTDAAIPQTAAIKRSEATLNVEYDGEPKFEEIEGTEVAHAVNTAAQVLKIDNRYYAVDNGVWFVAEQATGPWVVADEIPDEKIQTIPSTSPVYNTTYVTIYESTPEIVYVGYYPGYMWSFPYYGVPVYGTGWYYPPYYGRYYYPRPPTWGLHVGYNPWTGWNYGVSWSNGFMSVGVSFGGSYGHCCGGWYGGGYRRPVVINTGDINIGNSVNIGNRTNVGNRINNGDRTNINRDGNRNIYDRPENRKRTADRTTAQRDLQRARPSKDRANNVFADKNGNIARRDGDNWQKRENNSWKPQERPATNPDRNIGNRAQKPASNIDFGGLDRSHNSRNLGASREMHRSNAGRGGGMRRGR